MQTETYLLACKRYIELNPARARMVATPGEYEWSSYRHHIGEDTLAWMDEDPCYQALGIWGAHRRDAYARFVQDGIPRGEWELIREAVQRGHLTGNRRFTDEVESILGERIEHRRQGRPRKQQ